MSSSSSIENNKFHFSKFYSGEFEKVTEHIYRLNIPYAIADKFLPKFTIPVSVFLVHDSAQSRYSLIDVGPPGYEEMVMKGLAKFFDHDSQHEDHKNQRNALSEIDHVLITHFHIDHCGGVRKLWECSEQSLNVYSHSEDLEYIRDGKKFKEQKSEYWLFGMTKYLFSDPKMEVPCQTFNVIMNSKEDTVRSNLKEERSNNPTNDRSAQNNELHQKSIQYSEQVNSMEEQSPSNTHRHCLCACHCPGHTAGHTCFYHEEDRVLLCGGKFFAWQDEILQQQLIDNHLLLDALQNLSKKKSKLEYSYAPSSFNISLAKQNIKRLIRDMSKEIDLILPSHSYSMNGHTIEEVLKFVNK
nr:unnamed protein product [Naegleria fowleri]